MIQNEFLTEVSSVTHTFGVSLDSVMTVAKVFILISSEAVISLFISVCISWFCGLFVVVILLNDRFHWTKDLETCQSNLSFDFRYFIYILHYVESCCFMLMIQF